MRRSGLLFREPFRHFSVDEGAYDLVHCHVFSARFDMQQRLVVSNAAPITDLYSFARGGSDAHVRTAQRVDTALPRMLSVEHTSLRLRRTSRLLCATENLRQRFIASGLMPGERIDVVPISWLRGIGRAGGHPAMSVSWAPTSMPRADRLC